MREYDQMSTGKFWADREARLRREEKEDAEYASSDLGRREAARRTCNFLSTQKMDRTLTAAEEKELAEAGNLLGEI